MPVFDTKILTALADIVGRDRVLTDAEALLQYGRDWTRAYNPAPGAIVLPATTAQVQELVRLAEYRCHNHRVGGAVVAIIKSADRM